MTQELGVLTFKTILASHLSSKTIISKLFFFGGGAGV
jgi:hypothetical protein